MHTYYYTDPMCPWSWALEPALRKLALEFAGAFEVTLARAPAELWRPALEWRVRPERLGTGELWSLV